MARNPRSVQQAKTNLENSISLIPERYIAGINNANWQAAASSDQSEKNWATGVQQAVADKRRVAGIKRVSDTEWRQMAIEKGAASIGQGIRTGLNKYEQNFGKVYNAALTTIKALPPRTLDSRANVTNRVMPVVEAFKANRLHGKA